MSEISRRDFARTAVIASVAATVTAADAPAPPGPEAEARVASVLGRYGDRFTDQQKKELRERIVGIQAGLDAMRAYPLANDVEPATLFRVYRGSSRQLRVRTEKE